MIRFEKIVEDGDSVYCPVFICQQCGRPIQGPGLITWDGFDRPDGYDKPTFVALHKGACDRAYGRPVPWRDLSEFLSQLSYNTAHPFEADR
jgi:hypothetical protein